MAVAMDVREMSTNNSLNPFFEGGKAEPYQLVERNEGARTSGSGMLTGPGVEESEGQIAVLSSSCSGIAGFTMYQAQIDFITIPV